jgi:4-hydroxy-tetrahydrodipicolinate reductase
VVKRVLLVGHGRMSRLVESLCAEYEFEVAGRVDRAASARDADWPHADVAVDFSVADAVPRNLPRLAARGIPVVVGTTGWQAHEAELRADPAIGRNGVVAAPNIALGVNNFHGFTRRTIPRSATRRPEPRWRSRRR